MDQSERRLNMWKIVWQRLIEWLKGKKPVEPKPEPKPQDEATKTEMEKGFSHPAKIVAEIDLHHINKSGIFFSASKRGWKNDYEKCDGEAHLFVFRGSWQGGKFDKIRKSSTSRDWNNLNDNPPYGVWKTLGIPKSGEKIALMVVSFDKKERTNAIFADYP